MAEEDTTPEVAEMVRQIADAAVRGESDACTGFFAPDAVVQTGVGRFEGRDAIRGYVEDFWGLYDDLVIALEEFHDLGSGVAFGSLVATGRVHGTNAEADLRYAVVVTHARGVVSRWTDYVTPDEARAAAERLAKERG